MKKIFTLALLAMGLAVGTAQAQEKKQWDFTQGYSAETEAALDADETNWAKDAIDANGTTTRWKDNTKMTVIKANGEELPEFKGLSFGGGLSSSANYLLQRTAFRLARKNTTLIFPKLRNGQTITIVGRSANNTATKRGIEPSQKYLQYVGDEDMLTNGKCMFLGRDAEGSKGTYTFKWEVVTEETEPVDVSFVVGKDEGSIDFTLFMIDNGDAPAAAEVTYLYNGESDAVLESLQANDLYTVKAIDVTTSTITADELKENEVTIVANSVPADNAAVQVLKEAMPWTPVLNLNASLYAAWGYGETVTVPNVAVATNANHAFFKDVYLGEDEVKGFFVNEEETIQGVKLGDYFADDDRLAVAFDPNTNEGDKSVAVIHAHNINHNGYVYAPFGTGTLTEDAQTVFVNIISSLQNSKSKIGAATAPTLSRVYKNHQTDVTIKLPALPKVQAFYTTDGSVPTTESTPYEGTFTLTQPCTVKAVAIAEGYTLSAVASLDVLIKEQPKTPVIDTEMSEGKTTIKLSCDTEDAQIWFNFDNTTDTTKSSKYFDSIPVIINMPQTVIAFATTGEVGEAVFSETTTKRVLVQNPRVVIDVAAHFAAKAWDGISNGGGLFAGGKNATSIYDTTQEGTTTVDPETGDEVTTYPEVDWQTKDEPGDAPEWTVMTKGQAVLWQNNTASTDKVGTDVGGYYPSVATDIDPLFPITKNDIQFSVSFAGEKPNAAIKSKKAYQAPLDIVVLANMQGGPIVAQVSNDGETWTTVGEEIAKTGLTRMWAKYVRQYEGTDQVYVRLAQLEGDAACKIFDIYIANQGEKSQALLDEIAQEFTGIDEVHTSNTKAAAGVYSLNGVRLQHMQRGLNIVVGQDGQVRKVIVK